MATQITADLPTLNFPREVDYPTQEDWAAFSAAAEENFGILGGNWSTQMQLWKTEANAMSTELNTNATIAQGLANYQGDWVSQGYTLNQTVSIGEVYYICKLTHATGQNPTDSESLYWNLALGNWNLKVDTNMSGYTSKSTPLDADLIPLSDSVSSFGIKKLSWANLKATLKTYFDPLYFSISASNSKLGTDNLLMIQDQKASGTIGDSLTLNAWKKTTKNTVLINNIAGASVSSSVITLPAGTYYVESDEPVIVNNPTSTTYFKTRLRNVSDSSTFIVGSSAIERSNAATNESRSCLIKMESLFTINTSKNIEVEIYNSGIVGFNGTSASTGEVEVYGTLKIWKVG